MVDKSQTAVTLTRIGYLARGIVYVLIGYIALSSESAGKTEDGASGALDWIQEIPLGTPILYLCAIGLLGYAFFRLLTGILDAENHGTDAKGIAVRIGHIASAIVHIMLAWSAWQFANGTKQSSSDNSQDMAGTVLTYDFGGVVLGLVGLGFIVGAAMQAKNAVTANFMKRVRSDAPSATCWLGRIGHAARAVVFLVIGWSLMRSGWFSSQGEVKSLGDAVLSLRDTPFLYSLVAIGLIVFGIFTIIVARYRIIPDLDPSRHLKTA